MPVLTVSTTTWTVAPGANAPLAGVTRSQARPLTAAQFALAVPVLVMLTVRARVGLPARPTKPSTAGEAVNVVGWATGAGTGAGTGAIVGALTVRLHVTLRAVLPPATLMVPV